MASAATGIESLPDALKNQKFSCGDLIVKASPFVHVISMKHNGYYCDWCALPPSETGSKLLKCSACQYEHYCNKQCQKKAWKYHKFECPLLKVRYPKIPADTVRLMTKILWNLGQDIKRPEDDPGWRDWTDLCHHSDKLERDDVRKRSFEEIRYTLHKYVGEEKMKAHGMYRDVLPEFGRLAFNGFSLTHIGNGNEIGAAIYISPSVLNHSCAPNAAHVCDGTKLYVRAVKDIDTSKEPILVNYVDPLQPRALRQKTLWDDYYFQCKCAKCADDEQEALLESTICPNCEGLVVKQFDDTRLCQGCKKHVDDPIYIDSCEKAIDQAARLCRCALKEEEMDMETVNAFIRSNRLLSEKNVSLTNVKCALYADLSQFGDPAKAYALGEELTTRFYLYYPKVYPAHSVHQVTQARLAWHLDWYAKALSHYERAYNSLLLTHGREHRMRKMVESDMLDCQRDKLVFEKLRRSK